jgi:hypothetical protein
MRVKYNNSIEKKVTDRLKTIRGSVVLRKDIADIAAYRQISRALSKLTNQKKLVRISSGIYAKARASKYTQTPLIKGGMDITLRKVLDRLNVQYEPSSAEQAYNAGKSTQVPARNMVKLKTRCRRKIGISNNQLIFEKNKNAK